MGRFTSTQAQDVAVLAGEQLWAVSRPVTWGAYYAAGVSGVADIARLPRTTGAPNDHILCVGGGNPRLVSYSPAAGFTATVTAAASWQQVTRVEVAWRFPDCRAVGLEANGTSLRFGAVDAAAGTLVPVGERNLASPVLDMTYANWDPVDDAPEVVVSTAGGLEVYGWDGGPPRAVVARTVGQSHLACLRVRELHHLVWMHRPGQDGPWVLELWSGGQPRPQPVPPLFAGVIPEDVDIVNLAGADIDGTGGQALVDDLLVYHHTAEAAGDAVVLRYRPANADDPFLDALAQSAVAPVATDTCRMAFGDIDGDGRADAIRATGSPLCLHFKSPPTSRLESAGSLEAFQDGAGFQSIKLWFGVTAGCRIRITAWHQPSLAEPVLAAAAVTAEQEPEPDGSYIAALPPHSMFEQPGLFYLEVDYVESSGDVTSVLYPYVPYQEGFTNLEGYAEAGVRVAGPLDIHDNRNLSVVKRPILYEIQFPPQDPPNG